MTGYSKKGGVKGHHKLRGPAKSRKKADTKSINFNTMTPKIQNAADRALGKLRNGR